MKKQKRLKRDEEKAVIGGVLAGLANYYEEDPTLFRVLAVAFLVVTGFFPGLLFYIAAWIIMPALRDEEKFRELDVEAHTDERS